MQMMTIVDGDMAAPNQIVVWNTPGAPYGVIEVLQSSPSLLQYLLNSDETNDGCRPPSTHRRLLVFFPGNPGIVQFYEDFCRYLADRKFDVLVMGYAGHSLIDLNHRRCFALQDQLDIADCFLSVVLSRAAQVKYGAQVYLGGHSIGAYVAVDMAARYPSVKKCYGLCPAISHIAKAPKGRILSYFQNFFLYQLACFFATILTYLPYRFRLALVQKAEPNLAPQLTDLLSRYLNRSCLENILHMGVSEMRMVTEPDAALLRHVQKKLVLYYVKQDHWVPLEFAKEVQDICNDLGAVVVEDAVVPHAWCLKHSATVIEHSIMTYN